MDRVDHGTMFYKAVKEGLIDPARSVQVGIRTVNPNTLGLHCIDARMVHERGPAEVARMIKAILGEIEYEGQCELGHNAKVGYFAQNQAALLDTSLTVFQTVDEVAKGDVRTQIKNILGRFMFAGDDIDKKVSVLSGGEKTRLAMVKLLLDPVNLLILDEPTNHLDIKSKDVLKEALQNFDGTLILVSHDRDFLRGLSKKVFEFKEKRVIEHFETIDAFLQRNRIESIKEMDLMKG
jgi:ATP-binding cassette subfamily F protein 3